MIPLLFSASEIFGLVGVGVGEGVLDLDLVPDLGRAGSNDPTAL